jgi:4-carboxymuconolactone decarboxylase
LELFIRNFPIFRIKLPAYSVLVKPDSGKASYMDEKSRHAIQQIAEIAPKFGELTQKILFDDIWQRPQLLPRERSLITVAALVALNRIEQLPFHFDRAIDNGIDRNTLAELVTHLAFYSGWPTAASALNVLARLGDATTATNAIRAKE